MQKCDPQGGVNQGVAARSHDGGGCNRDWKVPKWLSCSGLKHRQTHVKGPNQWQRALRCVCPSSLQAPTNHAPRCLLHGRPPLVLDQVVNLGVLGNLGGTGDVGHTIGGKPQIGLLLLLLLLLELAWFVDTCVISCSQETL